MAFLRFFRNEYYRGKQIRWMNIQRATGAQLRSPNAH